MSETKWDKGDRLRITIEAEATSKHDYPTIFIKGALDYPIGLNVSSIESAGGTVSVEVLPKLPDGLDEQVLVWLAEHDRQVKADAWEEGWGNGNVYGLSKKPREENYINPYRQGENK